MHTPLLTLLPFLPLATPQYIPPTPSRTPNPLHAALKTAPTAYDRHALLPHNTDWYYDVPLHRDFSSPQGAVITVDAAILPALTDSGISIAVLKIAPCGLLPPHEHPRAANLVVGITGNTTSWMVGDNGVKTVTVDIIPLRVTLFPMGSVHAMQNNGCDEALLISALSSDDSGTNNVLRSVAKMPLDVIRAGFGNQAFDAQQFAQRIPEVGTGVIRGSRECEVRCGIAV